MSLIGKHNDSITLINAYSKSQTYYLCVEVTDTAPMFKVSPPSKVTVKMNDVLIF